MTAIMSTKEADKLIATATDTVFINGDTNEWCQGFMVHRSDIMVFVHDKELDQTFAIPRISIHEWHPL